MSKDTKGARYVASSLSGRELDALVVKCRLGQNLTIQKEEETNQRTRINYINHDINSHLKRPILYDKEAPSSTEWAFSILHENDKEENYYLWNNCSNHFGD